VSGWFHDSDQTDRKDKAMELLALAIILLALAVLGVLAITVGADSRESLGDDWSGGAAI
jgi:hypothetical protein